MPKYRTNFTLAPPRPHLPPDFMSARTAFRARDFDLYCESPIRFVARAAGETFGPWRTLADARAWLEARPVQTPASAMSSGAPPIGPNDGAVRERLRDLLALHAVRDALAPLRLSVSFGKVDRALDVLLDADAAHGGVLNAFGMSRTALAHQLRLVLATG